MKQYKISFLRRKSSLNLTENKPVTDRYQSLRTIKHVSFYAKVKTSVKSKSFARVKSGDKVKINGIDQHMCHIEGGFLPRTALEINHHCYNIYLEILPYLYKNINVLKDMINLYPDKICNLIRADCDIKSILSVLFKDELENNHNRNLDTETLRSDTPAIILCKEIIKTIPEWISPDLLNTIYPPEICIMIKILYDTITPENSKISKMELSSSFFCLRILCPLLFKLNVQKAKNIMKDPKIIYPIIENILNKYELRIESPCEDYLNDGLFLYNILKTNYNMDIELNIKNVDNIKETLKELNYFL